MYIDPDLRDRVYQLFSLEVPKMLQTIETELVTLSVDRSVTKVNNLMRAAHSIKGGAASLGLMEEYSPVKRLVYEAQIAVMMWRMDVEDGQTEQGIRQYQIDKVQAACSDVEEAGRDRSQRT